MSVLLISAAIVLEATLGAGKPHPKWHARAVFLSEARVATLKSRIEHKTEPTWSAWLKARETADNAVEIQPHAPAQWRVPFYYKDPQGHAQAKEGLQTDSNAAYTLALAYRMSGDEKYAQAAIRLLNAWATQVKSLDRGEDSGLSFSYHFPALIFAADLLKNAPSFPSSDQERFRHFVRRKAYPQNTMDRENNWGNWGVLLAISCATYVDDEKLFDKAVARWKVLTERQIAEDGRLTHEVTRGGFGRAGDYGLWYSHFSLMPQTLAAEVARVNGVDLFDYTSPSGRSLRQAFEWLAPYARDPARFPYFQGGDVNRLIGVNYISYFEILNLHWPNPDATLMIEKLRPLTAAHSAPFLTCTHGGLLNDAE